MTIIVPAYGPIDASIVFIGEAPGRDEVEYGRPFVGASGKLLRVICTSAGISLSECYLTNVIKEKPPSNNIKKFIDLTKKTPVITPEYTAYEDSLYKELLSLESVKVLVPVGNTALYATTRKFGKGNGITAWRGSILTTTIRGKEFKVVPTLHPAALLPGRGNYTMRYPVIHDLTRIKYQSEFSGIRGEKSRLIIEPTYLQVCHHLGMLRAQKRVYFDIEIYNQEVSCISFACKGYDSISIPFITEGRNYFTAEDETTIGKYIGGILEAEKIMKVAQNSAFDADFLFSKYGIATLPLGDTMIQHSILYPDLPRSLAFLTSIYTEQPYYKNIGQKIFAEGSSK